MTLKEEIEQVYADCIQYNGNNWDEVAKKRQLGWRWNGNVFPSNSPELAEALNLIGQYNYFVPEKVMGVLSQFSVNVVPARESSVCLYIYGADIEMRDKILEALEEQAIDDDSWQSANCKPDEADFVDSGCLRLWWD